MGWPEVVLAVINTVQLVALAWLAGRQQQVKKALNGQQRKVNLELEALRRGLAMRDP